MTARAQDRGTTATMLRGLPYSEYAALPGVRFSTLRHVDLSPLHYRHALANPPADTDALRLGRITHAAILTPDEPPEDLPVVVYPGIRRGKNWEAFKAEHAGETIVSESERAEARAQFDTARRVRAAVHANPRANALLRSGEGEVSVTWSEGDILCKARLDWVTPSGGHAEVKTTRSIHKRAFAADFARRNYHVQIALHGMGLRAACVSNTGADVLPIVIAIESSPPHDVAVYRIGYDTLEAGERKVREWLDAIARCEASGRWPGVDGGEVLDLRMPGWALDDDVDVPEIKIDEVA